MLQRSCNACHSNQTAWPWYSQVSPISWYLQHHVNEGRRELNFSDWATYDQRRAARKLTETCEEVKKGAMPTLRSARLTSRPCARGQVQSNSDYKQLLSRAWRQRGSVSRVRQRARRAVHASDSRPLEEIGRASCRGRVFLAVAS